MRSFVRITWLTVVLGVGLAGAVHATQVSGLLKLGGISLEEDAGDLSVVQETYNIYDGFNLAQILLNAQFTDRSFLTIDLHEINHDSRKGRFVYRVPGLVRVTASFDQHRQVFDADRAISSERKNWRAGVRVRPHEMLRVSANFSQQSREGERIGFPLGTDGVLGDGYDYTLRAGGAEVEVHKDGRGVALRYDVSDYSDNLFEGADRKGTVVSARAYGSDHLFPKYVSHFVRGAIGTQELSETNLDYDLATLQYTGVVKPHQRVQLKYGLYLSQIDNKSTELETRKVRHDADATCFYKYGRVFGGYGHVTNESEASLTDYNVWRVGTAAGYKKYFTGKVSYASSNKTDDEKRTLLQDIEAQRLQVKVQSQPVKGVTVGGSYLEREREYPDIDVETEGQRVGVFGSFRYRDWGSVTGDYSFSTEEYTNQTAPFETESDMVTARVDVTYVKDLHVAGGITYVRVEKDLDIEKSIIFVEGKYTCANDYFIEIKYNVYNYDDFILVDRFYTANVVWVNAGYNFSLQ